MLLPYSHGHDYYMPFYLLAKGGRPGFSRWPRPVPGFASSRNMVWGKPVATPAPRQPAPRMRCRREALRGVQQWPVALLLFSGGLFSQTPASGQGHSLTVSAEMAQGQYQDDVTRTSSSKALFCGLCGSGTSLRRMGYYHGYALGGGTVAYTLRRRTAAGIATIGLGIRGGTQRVGFRPQVPGGPFDASASTATTHLPIIRHQPLREGAGRVAGR